LFAICRYQTPITEYLIITPDRSLVFTAMKYFMSSVRKASALYPGIIVVIGCQLPLICLRLGGRFHDRLRIKFIIKFYQILFERALANDNIMPHTGI
jgi:hypothetical protein